MVHDALSLGRVQLRVRAQPEPLQGVINGSRLYEGWESPKTTWLLHRDMT